jgi:hypothetical protein
MTSERWTPDVPFCAAATRATLVVLARRYVRDKARVIAESGGDGMRCSVARIPNIAFCSQRRARTS